MTSIGIMPNLHDAGDSLVDSMCLYRCTRPVRGIAGRPGGVSGYPRAWHRPVSYIRVHPVDTPKLGKVY